ncbi:MAG: hypothetical protein WCO17_12690 [Betaproteobacteria bacterium]
MITALLSFLGGNVFRMIFGEIISYLNRRIDHQQEIERMRLQAELDAAQHQRQQAAIELQAGLGVKTIQVQAEAALGQIEAEGWLAAVKATALQTGIAWVDAWNATIRPGVATWAIIMLTLGEFGLIVLSENTIALAGCALGIYLADRSLMKRGK